MSASNQRCSPAFSTTLTGRYWSRLFSSRDWKTCPWHASFWLASSLALCLAGSLVHFPSDASTAVWSGSQRKAYELNFATSLYWTRHWQKHFNCDCITFCTHFLFIYASVVPTKAMAGERNTAFIFNQLGNLYGNVDRIVRIVCTAPAIFSEHLGCSWCPAFGSHRRAGTVTRVLQLRSVK